MLTQRPLSAYPTLYSKGIRISPKIRILRSGTLFQTLNLADFLLFAMTCQPSQVLPHWASTFVYNTVTVTQSIAQFVCGSWYLLGIKYKLDLMEFRLHAHQELLYPVYTIRPVVKPVLKTGLTTVLNEQPLFVQPVVKPSCTTGMTAGCIHDTAGCQTGCQTGLTTGWMFVYTIQVYTNI